MSRRHFRAPTLTTYTRYTIPQAYTNTHTLLVVHLLASSTSPKHIYTCQSPQNAAYSCICLARRNEWKGGGLVCRLRHPSHPHTHANEICDSFLQCANERRIRTNPQRIGTTKHGGARVSFGIFLPRSTDSKNGSGACPKNYI